MEMSEQRINRPIRPNKAAVVLVRPGQGTLSFELDCPELTIGRNIDNTIVLPDPRISRRHARIERGPKGDWFLINLQSRAGILLNGRRVASGEPARLTNRSTIRIVDHLFIFHEPAVELPSDLQDRFQLVTARELSTGKLLEEWLCRDGEDGEPPSRLLEIARILAAGKDPGTMLGQAIEELLAPFPQAAGGAVLVPREDDAGRFDLAIAAIRQRHRTRGFPAHAPALVLRAFERAESLLFIERLGELSFPTSPFQDGPLRTWVTVPLLGLDARLVGLFQVYSKPFDPDGLTVGMDEADQRPTGREVLCEGMAFRPEELDRLARRALPMGLAMDLRDIEQQNPLRAYTEIQAALPQGCMPEVPGYSLSTWMPRSLEFDGRVHDIFARPAGFCDAPPRWITLLGAAPGPLLLASLVLAELRLETGRLVRAGVDLETILSRLHQLVHALQAQPDEISLCLAELDAQTHRLTAVCAGACARLQASEALQQSTSPVPAICGPPPDLAPEAAHSAITVNLQPGEWVELRMDHTEDAKPDGWVPCAEELIVRIARDPASD
jgi:pSer/pThr/pTyr-binding forkhead associated (FHA) protein